MAITGVLRRESGPRNRVTSSIRASARNGGFFVAGFIGSDFEKTLVQLTPPALGELLVRVSFRISLGADFLASDRLVLGSPARSSSSGGGLR